MTPDELAQEICDHFLEKGEWPLARDLQAKHRKSANIRVLAKRLGWERGGCSDGADGRCIVQLREIATCSGSEKALQDFVSAIRFVARSCVEKGSTQISSEDLSTALGLSGHDLRIVGGLLAMASGMWTQASWTPQNSQYWLQPAERAMFFDEIASLQEYFDTEDRVSVDEREAALIGWAPLPPNADEQKIDSPAGEGSSGYLLRDKDLASLLDRDMAELRRVLEVGAWKAAAILAGSCIEILLFDLWKADEENASAHFKNAWPNHVAAHQLATAAVRKGMISHNQEQLVSFLRDWRNLIHPSAALRSPVPTEKLGRTLLPIVELLLADLGLNKARSDIPSAG